MIIILEYFFSLTDNYNGTEEEVNIMTNMF